MKKKKIEIGVRVGHLEVIGSTNQRKNGYMIWKCACDCGNIIELDTRTLQRNTKQDCGCKTKIPSGSKDLTGQCFGLLKVIGPTQKRQHGCLVWECACECGNITYVSTHQLTCGYTKSCGCLSHPPLKKLVNRRFGHLKVISYDGKRAGMHRRRCVCDCGNETSVGQTLLQTGKTKSCGCIQAGIIKDNLKLVEGTSITILETKNKIRSNNSSGHVGVYQNKKNQKWIAQITFKGKTYYLGSYQCLEDALNARKRGEEMHQDFIDWYYNEYLNDKSFKD